MPATHVYDRADVQVALIVKPPGARPRVPVPLPLLRRPRADRRQRPRQPAALQQAREGVLAPLLRQLLDDFKRGV
jgi:hypothetical protein